MDLAFLYGLKREGIKLDLDIMKEFAPNLDNPQDKFRSFHIAGTNGKGSVSSYIYNILNQAYSTGLYTSPHLVKFNERILLDREFIPDSFMEAFMSRNIATILRLQGVNRNPTFFETTTLMAFDFFAKEKAEYASVEVGLGGRLDSTNIITPVTSVICNIGYEHFDRLGCSIDSIAFEKGGIVKKGIPFVLADSKPDTVRTMKRISEIRNSKMHRVQDYTTASNVTVGLHGLEFDLKGMNDEYHITSRMLGEHQILNIRTAVLAMEVSGTERIDVKAIEKGISRSIYPGRMEVISESPFTLIDCAHNPPAARTLVTSYKRMFSQKTALLIGMLSDKDWYTFARTMSEIADDVVFTTPDEEERALDPEKFDHYCGSFFKSSKVIANLEEAFEYMKNKYDRILITGSIYLIGKIKEITAGNLYPYISS